MGRTRKSAPAPTLDEPPPAPKFGSSREATQRVYEQALWGAQLGGMAVVTSAERTLPGAA